jgi:hypothetical protein
MPIAGDNATADRESRRTAPPIAARSVPTVLAVSEGDPLAGDVDAQAAVAALAEAAPLAEGAARGCRATVSTARTPSTSMATTPPT